MLMTARLSEGLEAYCGHRDNCLMGLGLRIRMLS